MTLASVGPQYFPQRMGLALTSTTLGANVMTFDSSTDRMGYVGTAPITDTLTKIHFRVATVTSGPTLDVRVETVSNGRPSGTLFGTNTNASHAVSGSNTWQTVTLTAGAAMNDGDDFAIVLNHSSGTANFQMSQPSLQANQFSGQFPCVLQDTGGGTWALPTSNANGWNCMLEFQNAGIVPVSCLLPMDGAGTLTAFNSGSTPNERALKLVVPMKCRVIGASVFTANNAAGSDLTVSIWPASSSTDADKLAQKSLDGDSFFSATQDGYTDVYFSDKPTVNAGDTIYIGLRADTANNNGIGSLSSPSGITGSHMGFPIPATCHQSTRTWTAGTAGSWSDSANVLPLAHLIIDQLDDGAGGSGGDTGGLVRFNAGFN